MNNKYILFFILMLIVGSSFLLYENFESFTFSTVPESTSTTNLNNSTTLTTTTTVPETTTTSLTTTTTVPETTTTTSTTTTTVPETTTTSTTTTTSSTTTTTVPETTTTSTTTTTSSTTTTTVPETTTTSTTTTTSSTTTTTVPETTTTSSTTTTTVPEIINITVTVSNDGSGSEYYLNGSKGATIDVSNGTKYRFDQSDSSNSGHPLRISNSQEGSQYTLNVTTYGTPGNSGAYTEIEITPETPSTLYIYCSYHFGMGGNNVLLKS